MAGRPHAPIVRLVRLRPPPARGRGQDAPAEPGDRPVGIVDEEPVFDRLRRHRHAVGIAEFDRALAGGQRHLKRAGVQAALATRKRSPSSVLPARPPRWRSAASRTGVAVCDRLRSLAMGVLVDLGDRGAGQDVVELVEEERLPGGLELVARIGEAVRASREGGEGLGFEQAVLAGAVERLDLAPGWSACRGGTPGRARPTQTRQPLGRQGGEELLDAGHAQARQRREILDARVVLEHPPAWAAAAVAPAEGEQALRVVALARGSCARCRGCRAGRCCRCSRGRARLRNMWAVTRLPSIPSQAKRS